MVRNTPLGLAGLVLLAGSVVMLFFVILSGVKQTTPLSNTYFLRADTSSISGARSITQWTYFYMCGDGNADCGPAWPAPPFGWAWSANPANAPGELIGSYGNNTTSEYYYYMWRFGWVLYLIALFFDVAAFFTSFLACCGRLGAGLAGIVALIALFFFSIAVSLMTATFVKARNAFNNAGRDAQIGTWAFGFSWGAWAALLLAVVLFFAATAASSRDGVTTKRSWRRSRSVRSTSGRYDGRRVKDDYS